jgi:hypothetical protein
MIVDLGDAVLESRHTAIVMERVADEHLDEAVRVAGIHILGAQGILDKRVHELLRRCAQSKSPTIASAAKEALEMCLGSAE